MSENKEIEAKWTINKEIWKSWINEEKIQKRIEIDQFYILNNEQSKLVWSLENKSQKTVLHLEELAGKSWDFVWDETFQAMNKMIIRVRISKIEDEIKSYITIKGESVEGEGPEFEKEIHANVAQELLPYGMDRIKKERLEVNWGEDRWEVDCFKEDLVGNMLAELEVKRKEDLRLNQDRTPIWVEKEVTDDPRYKNAALGRLGWPEERSKGNGFKI